MKERVYEIEVVMRLEIPVDAIPIGIFKSTEEILDDKTVVGKFVELHVPEHLKKDLVGEFVKVKSGIYENMAYGWITEVKKISLGKREWK